MTHDWQLEPLHGDHYRHVYRCSVCGTYRVRCYTEGDKHLLWTRYSPLGANINNTLPWRSEEPQCKTTKEPQS